MGCGLMRRPLLKGNTMSLIFADPGGAFYSTTTQATEGLWAALSATIKTSGLPAGNVEPTALQIGNVGGVITVPNSPGTYTIGFRFVSTSVITSQSLVTVRDPSNSPQLTFTTNPNGTITVTRGGGGGTVLGTSATSTTLSQNAWSYVEFQFFIDGSAGTVAININGSSVLNLTAQNTKGSSTTTNVGNIAIGSNLTSLYQDIYVTNSSGTHNTGFLGDVQMPVSLANANGTYTAWTPNGAATIYQSVNAATPADSTIFASDSTPTDRMSVSYPSTSVTGTIVAVAHVSRMLKSTSGTRTVSQVVTSNGVDQVGPAQSLNTTYTFYEQISETDPNTGLGWSQSGFNQIQTGLITES
jgi:hypothetical protein